MLNQLIVESENKGDEEMTKKYKDTLQIVTKQINSKSNEKRFVNLSLSDKSEVKLINELSMLKAGERRKNSL